MKLIIVLLSIAVTGAIAILPADRNISGTWVLQTNDRSCNQPVLRFNMGEGIWQGKLDIPEQELYDRKIYSVRVNGDSVFINVFKNGSTIYGKLVNDSTITGNMQFENSKETVKLKKI